MKGMKIVGVIILFGIAIYLGLGMKKRVVQSICKDMGDYKATKGEELMDGEKEIWYCCPPKQDKNTKNCLYYGD